MSEKKYQPKDWREGRRLRGWELYQQGWSQKAIAEALGVTKGAVSQWIKRGREGGAASLHRRTSPGAPRRLTQEQVAQLPVLLEEGAEAHGFRGALWTCGRVAAVIEAQFAVRYHPDHVSRLLKQLGWSPQKPVTRATQRDEEAIVTWREERWPALKKGSG